MTEHYDDSYDAPETEITLGTGRLLTLFFGLVIVCAVFFGLGFTLGRNSNSPAPIVTSTTQTASAAAIPASGAAKPNASHSAAAQSAAPAAASNDDLEVKTVDSSAKSAAAPAKSRDEVAAESVGMKVSQAAPAPEIAHSAVSAEPGAGFVVQVAAVTRKDDADALVGALRKKNYPVFVANDAGDHLFHVQVGPFADRPAAMQIKDKLAGDGYNAIVK